MICMPAITEHYNDYLKNNPLLAGKMISYVSSAYRDHEIMLGDKLLPFFLTPNFMSESEERLIKKSSEKMSEILEKVGKQIKNVKGRLNTINRMDFFIHEDKIKFIEFNTDSPSGAGRLDIINDVYLKIPIMPEIEETIGMRESLLEALLSSYKEWGGEKEKPNLVLIDWKDVKTISDQKLVAEYFNEKGFRTVLADPRELVYKEGKLFFKDMEIDIVYKRVIIKELLGKKEECNGLFSALSEDSVFMANPLESGILGEKKIISRMSSGEFDNLLNDEEKKFIKESLPWTTEVSEDLKEKILSEKNKLVLKPDEEYGGEGVTIGKNTPEEEWKNKVNKAVHEQGWVVQEYIEIPAIEVFDNGEIRKKFMNVSSFIFGGKYAGCMTRVSDDPVVNTSRGGGIIPTFVIKNDS